MNDNAHRPILVIGLGCQRGCPALALRALIDDALQAHNLQMADISALASIDQKSDEPGLLELAGQLGLPLVFFSAAELTRFESQLSHRSSIAFTHTGCYGVAESAALALAERLGGSLANLLIPRRNSANATFALAEHMPR